MFWIFLRDTLQLIMAPVKGWEDIAYDDLDLHRLITRAFVPWLVIAAATSLTGFAYDDVFSLMAALHGVISTFLMFFVSFYLAVFLFSFYMPALTKGASIEAHNNTLILFSTGLLALIEIIRNLLPIDLAMLNFFPLYVLYIMWRGARYLKVARMDHLRYSLLCLAGVIIPPYLLQFLFSLILPS